MNPTTVKPIGLDYLQATTRSGAVGYASFVRWTPEPCWLVTNRWGDEVARVGTAQDAKDALLSIPEPSVGPSGLYY